MNRDPLEVGIFPCGGYLVFRVFVIPRCLSIWGRHMGVIWPWYMMRKIFPCRSMCGEHTWKRRTRRVSSSHQLYGQLLLQLFCRYGMHLSAFCSSFQRVLHHLSMRPTTLPWSSAFLVFCLWAFLCWKYPYQYICGDSNCCWLYIQLIFMKLCWDFS